MNCYHGNIAKEINFSKMSSFSLTSTQKVNIKWFKAIEVNRFLHVILIKISAACDHIFCRTSFTNSVTIVTQNSEFMKNKEYV